MTFTKTAALLGVAALSILAAGVRADDSDPAARQQQILAGQLKALSDALPAELKTALAEAQERWAAYRDQQCAFEGKFMQEIGRRRQEAGADAQCLARFNQQRLQELQGYLAHLMTAQQRQIQTQPQSTAPTGQPSSELPTVCQLRGLPANFEVLAVGSHHGIDLADIRIAGNKEAVHEAQVVVNKPGVPVVLVLSAYESVVWRVSRTPQTTIAGVIVGGGRRQLLLGVDKATPKVFAVYDEATDCGHFVAADASERLTQAAEMVKRISGRAIDTLVSKPTDGRYIVGDAVGFDPAMLVSSNETKLEDYAGVTTALAGQRGLDALIAQGKLRRATDADIQAWVEKATAANRQSGKTLAVRPPFIPLERTYVVLASTDLPLGLGGRMSSLFIVPEGVPAPSGLFGSFVLQMSDGACLMHGTSSC